MSNNKRKKHLLVLFMSLLFSTSLYAQKVGLKQKIITKYLGYSYQPKFRKVFNQIGQKSSFQERNIEFLRDRVTPMLNHFKNVFKFSIEQKVPLIDYNPTLDVIPISPSALNVIHETSYPASLRWISRKDAINGKEFITLSFKSRPSAEQFMNTIVSLENILALNLKRKPMEPANKKKIRLTKNEKEMLEPIKRKTITLTKYQRYYGVYYQFRGLVQATYLKSFKQLLEAEFASIQESFKYVFYRSKKVNMSINAKMLLNLEEKIESESFKDLLIPFEMNERLLPKDFLRLTVDKNVAHLRFLFARKASKESVDPILKSMLSKL